jgi:prolyl-tRNA editing enzyme YbaK/EbsC (Cys-tRNA(Pro) deacylase)
MTPYEVMLSESQERMLVIVKPQHEDDVRALFEHWELHCATIGVVTDDGRRSLVVLDATDQLDLARARRLMNARHVRLLREDELAEISPAVEVGALPPVPLWHLPIYADYAVRYDPEISFPAGTHTHAVRVDRESWEESAGVIYGDLAMDVDGRPIWARS